MHERVRSVTFLRTAEGSSQLPPEVEEEPSVVAWLLLLLPLDSPSRCINDLLVVVVLSFSSWSVLVVASSSAMAT